MKKDGHTHTEFCPHGSREDVELMIQRAIQLGFTDYSITEHAPLPPEFRADYEGSVSGFDEAAIAMTDVDAYLKKAHAMQAKYRDQIHITVGFEVDYLPTQVAWTRDFLNEYGPQTDENILSVHFMRGTHNHFWCVDNELDEFETGLLPLAEKDLQNLYAAYFNTLRGALLADLGDFAPKRVGHLTLIKKFQDYFHLPQTFDNANIHRIGDLLTLMKTQGRALDLNVAGLFKPYCNETYPTMPIVWMARARKLPIVYGSDAHSVAEVGHAYHMAAGMMYHQG